MKFSWPTIVRLPLVLALGLLLTHCGQTETEESDLDAATSATSITGQWRMVSYKGSYVENAGTGAARDKPMSRTFTAANANAVSTFSIAANGAGTIKGKETCKPNINAPKDQAASIQASRTLNAVEGVVGLIQALIEFRNSVSCTPGQVKNGEVRVTAKVGPFGGPDKHLPLNVGVMGESSGNSEKECNLMRGVRYVKIDQSDACIGFNNAQATEVKMLILRPGEIRTQRVILRRP